MMIFHSDVNVYQGVVLWVIYTIRNITYEISHRAQPTGLFIFRFHSSIHTCLRQSIITLGIINGNFRILKWSYCTV